MANLTCMQYWVTYLRVLQQAVWPGGNLPAHPRPQRTQQQKDDTKQQSLQCLMNLLPGRFPFLPPLHIKLICCYALTLSLKLSTFLSAFPECFLYSLFFLMCVWVTVCYAYVYRSCFRYTGLREVQAFLAGRSRVSPRFYHKQVGLRTVHHTQCNRKKITKGFNAQGTRNKNSKHILHL